ncbi:MAG: hypothetical protein JXB36_19165 [Gammaproteobacteria bacterium]|nr:hypothetical protein [Gammaproteobacteria bacterium]
MAVGKVWIGALSLVSLAVASAPALSHHSAAMFDDEVTLTLHGTVTRFDYVNPHSWLYVDVENEDGSVTEWGFELDAPPRLRRLGISPKYWEEGDAITVKTHPLKDGRPAGSLVGAVAAEDRTFGDTEGIDSPDR